MEADTTAAMPEGARVEQPHLLSATTLADYWALTKPEVNILIAITTFAGFYLPTAFILLILNMR